MKKTALLVILVSSMLYSCSFNTCATYAKKETKKEQKQTPM